MKKRLFLALLLAICMAILTGCGDEIKGKIIQDIRARATLNTDQINHMRAAGLLDEASAEELIKGITATADKACASLEGDVGNLVPYVSWYKPGNDITNHFGLYGNGATYRNNAQALSLVSEEYKNKLGDILNYDVYELNGDVNISEVKTIIEAAKSAIASNDTTKMKSAFNTLGQPGKYFKKTGKLLRDNDVSRLIRRTTTNPSNTETQHLGEDFKIRDPNTGEVVMTIKLLEFNNEIIEKLINLDGLSQNTYLLDKENKRIYKLVYPIYAISSIELDSQDSTKFITKFSSANCYINLYNNVISSDELGADQLKQGSSDIQIIKVSGASGEPDQSSFVVKDGKVILRDYLELTYLPGVVEGEKWVALGRRVRVQTFEGSLTETYAKILNKKGEVDSSIDLYVSDLLSLGSDSDFVESFRGKAVKLGDESKNSDSSNNNTEYMEHKSVNTLEVYYSSSIDPALKLGCNSLATQDKDAGANGKMYIKGLCIGRNLFESQLYKSWVEGQDTEFGNLQWWNSWLEAANFRYRIDANKLTNVLMDSYQFEMRQEGYIIIDSKVVKHIQNTYNQQDKEGRVGWIRTTFTILGIVLMAYAILLIGAWTFDVNILAGPRILTTITFGQWEAIQDSSELPDIRIGEKSYMTFSKTLSSSLKILGLGFLLTIVDIVEIVLIILKLFGSIADVISRVLFGTM